MANFVKDLSYSAEKHAVSAMADRIMKNIEKADT